MKTKEFEKAIDALNLGIVIDEMKLNHSNVRQVTGHLENEGIIGMKKERVSLLNLNGEKIKKMVTL